MPSRTLRRLSVILVTVSIAVSAWQSSRASEPTYTNPILPGDWSDPGVIRVGDDFYSCRSSFGWQPGIPIAHSRDLVH